MFGVRFEDYCGGELKISVVDGSFIIWLRKIGFASVYKTKTHCGISFAVSF